MPPEPMVQQRAIHYSVYVFRIRKRDNYYCCAEWAAVWGYLEVCAAHRTKSAGITSIDRRRDRYLHTHKK